MNFRKYLAPLVLSLLSATYIAHAQVVNPSQPATGVPLAGTGIAVSGQTVSVNYAVANSPFTGNLSVGGTLTAGTFSPANVTATGTVSAPSVAASNVTVSATTVTNGLTVSAAAAFPGTVSGVGLDNYEKTQPQLQTVLNVAALRTTSCVSGLIYTTQGYTALGDNGQGQYVCNGSDTTTADNGGNIIAAANTFRYYLVAPGSAFNQRQFGLKCDGSTDDTTRMSVFLNAVTNAVFLPGTCMTSNVIVVSTTGNNRTLFFQPGVFVTNTSSATAATAIFEFDLTGSNFRFIGNGVQLGYSTTPTTRTNHAFYVTGTAIVNAEISGVVVNNGANMGIAVFAGPQNGTASGNHDIYVHDCHIQNTLGDGVHIEDFDSGVDIANIVANNVQDDVIAVLDYTGAAPAPIHPSQTVGVVINHIRSTGVRTGTISLAGAKDFVVSDVQEEANTSFAAFTLKLTHAAGYTVGNSNGTIDGVVTTGAAKLLVLDTPGAVTSTAGTNFNQSIKVGKIVGNGILSQGISMSNSGTAAGGALKNITVASAELHGVQGFFLNNVANVRMEDVYGDTFTTGSQIVNSSGVSWGLIKLQGYAASTTVALSATGDSAMRPGKLQIDATNCTTGLQFQSNTGVTHDGLWTVANATTANYTFGSNTGVLGYFQETSGTQTIGAVSAGSTTNIPYTLAVPSGSNTISHFTVIAPSGLRWGVSSTGLASANIFWTDAQTITAVVYDVFAQAN